MLSLFQFSMRGLLAGIAVVSLGIAALVNAGPLWQGIMWGVVLYLLVTAILLVVYRRAQTRAFWLGFTTFGWSYLLLFLTSQAPGQFQFWVRSDPLRYSDLLATRLAQGTYNLLPESRRLPEIAINPPSQPAAVPMAGGSAPGMGGSFGDMSGTSMGGGADMMMGGMNGMMPGRGVGPMGFQTTMANANYVPLENFMQVFHALGLLLAAAIGGKTCQFIYRTRPREEQ